MVRKDRKFHVSLALHEAVAGQLQRDPERVRELGLRGVQKVLPHNRGFAAAWVQEWERLLQQRDWGSVLHHLTSEDETSVEMRNCTVFLGALTQQHRRQILDDVYAKAEYIEA